MKEAAKTVQFGLRSPQGMKEYRKLLEGGVVNTILRWVIIKLC